MQNAIIPYQIGYDFGIGVDSASGNSRQLGAAGSPTQVSGAGGGEGSFQMVKIESISELEDHLGISADASAGIGLFSASARFDFAKDCKIQTNSIALLLTCTRQLGFTQIDKPVLDVDAGALVGNGQTDLFMQRYGDCFVRGIQSGGQFFGVIRIDVRTEEDHQTINASLSGSYGPFSADVQTNVSSALKQTNSSAFVYLYYEGGDVQTKPQNPQDIFTAADEWSKSVLTAPKPYSVLIVPWIIANGPQPPNAVDLQNQKDVLITCAKLRSQIIDGMNVLEYIIDPAHQKEFQFQQSAFFDPKHPTEPLSQGISLGALQNAYANISMDHDIVMKAASYALDNAKGAVEPITYARTIGGKPNYTLTPLPTLPKRVDGKPATLVVPSLIGLHLPDAFNKLKAAGFPISPNHPKITFIHVPVTDTRKSIISQDPAPGTSVAPGSSISFSILSPDLINGNVVSKVPL